LTNTSVVDFDSTKIASMSLADPRGSGRFK
jgi:hypothetical protein